MDKHPIRRKFIDNPYTLIVVIKFIVKLKNIAYNEYFIVFLPKKCTPARTLVYVINKYNICPINRDIYWISRFPCTNKQKKDQIKINIYGIKNIFPNWMDFLYVFLFFIKDIKNTIIHIIDKIYFK